jgi:RimJ/RimL family protein N-acetyltransferase
MPRTTTPILRLERIVTITQRENAPSIKLLERLGARLAPAPAAWAGMLMATLENDRT